MTLKFMYITNDVNVALIAEKYGVDRIWIDLETLGKEERQKNMDSVKSNHSIEDIKKIAPLLTKSEMLVRINPINVNSENEINTVIDAGADIIMLPMDEIHIGLNDLHLSYNLSFMFELLSNGTVEKLCKKIAAKGIPYGFGGIAKLGEGILPAERIIMEHFKYGSTRAILSRSFCNYKKINDIKKVEYIFSSNMKILKNFEKSLEYKTEEEFINNSNEIQRLVEQIVKHGRNCNGIK